MAVTLAAGLSAIRFQSSHAGWPQKSNESSDPQTLAFPSTPVAMQKIMDATPTVELAALSDLSNYRVSASDVDPRGWTVIDTNHVQLGPVTDLIIDLDALIARYIVLADTRAVERAVLLPIGFARTDIEQKVVFLDFLSAEDVDAFPSFRGLPLSAEDAAKIEKAITGKAPTALGSAKVVRRTDETRSLS